MPDEAISESLRNRRWVLARRPSAPIPTGEDFRLEEVEPEDLADGEILVRTAYFSLDVHTRWQMTADPSPGVSREVIESRMPPFPLGEAILADGVGEVLASRDERFRRGDFVQGYLGWQTLAVVRGGSAGEEPMPTDDAVVDGRTFVRRIPGPREQISLHLNALGEFGLTAYVGLLEVGRPRAGETVFVSSAAGVVGSVAGQVARIKGCRTVGSVGSAAKEALCRDRFGFDATVNYRDSDIAAQLDRACPDGIDVYFDNVGGRFSDLVVERMRPQGRIVICGVTADWLEGAGEGPRLYWPFQAKRLRMEGYVLWDFKAHYAQGYADLRQWVAEGRLRTAEHVTEGIEAAPQAFAAFLRGEFAGKALVHVGSPQEQTED